MTTSNTTRGTDGPAGRNQRSKYPVYDNSFWYSITFECVYCGEEIYEREEDSGLVCGFCSFEHDMGPDGELQPVRAKCHNCGEISDTISGSRSENLSFNCPHCPFRWKSSPH
jgi:DNA-directed RNA polymerase subunit RPC12/RpoP